MARRARLHWLVGGWFVAAALAAGCSCGDPNVPPVDDASLGDASSDARRADGGDVGCGDGVRQRDEVCDDGNTEDGDGCSADCLSDETCGNGYLDTPVGELCDDSNTESGDACRADCLSDYRCGNGVLDTVADGAASDEICDDGNTENGDGCSATCDSDETCGNGTVDIPAGEVCDDGNAADGDACSADCTMSFLCGNGAIDGVEECDDGNTDPGDGCAADCFNEICGNARLDAAELCDDGDTDDANGCRTDCTYTCSSDVDCDDLDVCNGAETCANGGTTTSACVPPAAPAVDGTACGADLICRGGVCAASGCGDGVVDPARAEVCDDGNSVDGDGCDSDCTFTCSTDADCSDGEICSGTETCAGAGTAASACLPGTPPGDGASCGSGLICTAGSCVAAACGDGFVTAPEACDDGNTANGDGCDADCTFTCASDADCADTAVCNGAEVCSSPGTTASTCGAGTPPADGTSCGGSNICRAGACVAAACGDGIRSGTEQCDDGNTANSDGCDADCTYTCASAADCSDGLVCNGTETCSSPGTLASRCGAGTPPTNGTDCDGTAGSNVCLAGNCVAPGCGDGLRTGTEQCDDGNTASGDGCDGDCTWTCASAADCSDGLVCNGTETCSSPGTLASRCGTGTVPANGTDCDGTAGSNICVSGSCVAPRCGDRIVSAGEQCDDGNTVETDGCRSTCRWTCATAADCSDGLVCNGAETCTSGGTVMSRCGMGTTAANGTDCDGTAGSNICVSGSCVAPRCGDAIVSPGEQCDDGNTNNLDGCRTSCTWTCTTAGGECSDGLFCNGTEVCTGGGTISSRCGAGTPPATGTDCDGTAGSNICIGGACVAPRCGDAFATAPEQCDDGNTITGDGCEPTCRYTCTTASDCAGFANVCDGTETCTSGGTTASRCVAGTPPAVGTACDRDTNPATRDICRMSACVASVCGDTFVDSGAMPPELCDDGNTTSGDGCSATCQLESTPPTAFRVTTLSLISPRVVVNPGFGCQDITQNCYNFFGCQADSVNTQIANAINPMSTAGGTYSLHVVDLFRPLVAATVASTPIDIHFNAACMEAPTPDSCGPDPVMPDIVSTTARNTASGTACFTPVAADVNGRRGTATVTYSPTASTASTPCFVTDPRTIMINLGGIMVPLQNARIAGTYSGTPATRVVNGVLSGFLSEADAMTVILPATLPAPLGGAPLYSVLQAGGATGSGCNVGGGTAEDDRDMSGTTRGFWFYLNYSADLITWSGP